MNNKLIIIRRTIIIVVITVLVVYIGMEYKYSGKMAEGKYNGMEFGPIDINSQQIQGGYGHNGSGVMVYHTQFNKANIEVRGNSSDENGLIRMEIEDSQGNNILSMENPKNINMMLTVNPEEAYQVKITYNDYVGEYNFNWE